MRSPSNIFHQIFMAGRQQGKTWSTCNAVQAEARDIATKHAIQQAVANTVAHPSQHLTPALTKPYVTPDTTRGNWSNDA